MAPLRGSELGHVVHWGKRTGQDTMARLVITERGQTRSIPLGKRTSIGRAAGNDLVFDDKDLSRNHCEFVRQNERDYIIDLGSLNGTLVNSELIKRHPLDDGDTVEIGGVRMIYEAESGTTPARRPVDMAVDPGSGLLSDPYLRRVLIREVQRNSTLGGPLCLALVGIQALPALEAELGEAAVDRSLAQVGQAIADSEPPLEVYRFGLGCLALLLPGPLQQARERATVLHQHVASVQLLGGAMAESCFGLACLGEANAPWPESIGPSTAENLAMLLLEQADRALAAGISQGRAVSLFCEDDCRDAPRSDALAGIVTGDPGRDYRNVSLLLETIFSAHEIRGLDELLQLVVDRLIKIADAERGILYWVSEGDDIEIAVARSRAGEDLKEVDGTSKSIPHKALTSGRAVVMNAPDTEGMTASMLDHKLRSVMCAPVAAMGRVVGVLYVDGHRRSGAFRSADVIFFEALCRQIGVALEKSRLMELRKIRQRELEDENIRLREGLAGRKPIIGESEPMRKLMHLLGKIAPSEVSVLIYGESGTGKEAIARGLHERSNRSQGPFIVVDCGAISENLLESQLFGHEKGSFTGASARTEGQFAQAHQGTIFLDEVGELPLNLQVKLLRVLQEKTIQPIGGTLRKVDVRIIAATHRDLEKMVSDGRFRQDLFYRLSVFPVSLPALRERGSDILLLASHFLGWFSALNRKQILGFTKDAQQQLLRNNWPGNVRELEHNIHRAVLIGDGPYLTGADLQLGSAEVEAPGKLSLQEARRLANDRFEREIVSETLKHTQGNVTRAAEELQVSRQILQKLMRKHEIRRERFLRRS